MMTSSAAITIVVAFIAAAVCFCWIRNRIKDEDTMDQYYKRIISRADDWR